MTTINMNQVEMLKSEMVELRVMMDILPESKVNNTDMFGRKWNEKGGMPSVYQIKLNQLTKLVGKNLAIHLEEIQAEYDDRIQSYLDNEAELHVNEEVDDVNSMFVKSQQERFDESFVGLDGMLAAHVSEISGTWATASAAQERHDRMVKRLTAARLKMGNMTDDEVEALEIQMDKKELAKTERMILRKEQAVFFRRKLEEKAVLLRELSYKAERSNDKLFIAAVVKLATKTKEWAAARSAKGVNSKPYSKSALFALFNEAVYTLHALGMFKDMFLKTEFESDIPCSFFIKKVQEGMVEVKSGLNWADEIAVSYYGVDASVSEAEQF